MHTAIPLTNNGLCVLDGMQTSLTVLVFEDMIRMMCDWKFAIVVWSVVSVVIVVIDHCKCHVLLMDDCVRMASLIQL